MTAIALKLHLLATQQQKSAIDAPCGEAIVETMLEGYSMEDTRVFERTALGHASYANPRAQLTQSQRTLLIMMDGKKPLREHRRLAAVLGDVDALTQALLDAGMVVELKLNAASDFLKSAEPTALITLKAAASRHVAQTLGSFGDRLCFQIEDSHDMDALKKNLDIAANVLSDIKGSAQAHAFRAEMAEYLSPA